MLNVYGTIYTKTQMDYVAWHVCEALKLLVFFGTLRVNGDINEYE